MDMVGKDTNVETQKGGEDPVNYHAPNMSSDWRINGNNLTNSSIGMIPMGNSMVETSACSTGLMGESFCPPIWDQPINVQSLGYSNVNIQNDAMLRGGMFVPSVPGMLPQSMPHFPADSSFIERAARFSCFSGGNFGEMMNPFSIPDPLHPYSRGCGLMQEPHEVFEGNALNPLHGIQLQGDEMNMIQVPKEASLTGKHGTEGSPFKNEKKIESLVYSHDEAKQGVRTTGNESDEAECSGRGTQDEFDGAAGETSGKGLGSKKRKRGRQNSQPDENNEATETSVETAKDTLEIKQKGDQNPTSISKPGKQGSQGSDPPKEDYIHIRARRGQATNSHSLAERVRREKISERMKFLQDLVPGCSKVTGKAVMLDEIINYVQSLQRQVEFLSMKLATVNPRLDFNIEGCLAKDILQPRAGMSSLATFPPDMTMPFLPLHPSHPGLIQACHPGNSSETLRRPTNLQSAAVGGFKEPASQVWEDELHNVVHMGFNSSSPLNSQDLSGSLPAGHMKAEL